MIKATYIDHMGSDLSVVNAARVSFGKKSDWLPRVHSGEEKVLNPFLRFDDQSLRLSLGFEKLSNIESFRKIREMKDDF